MDVAISVIGATTPAPVVATRTPFAGWSPKSGTVTSGQPNAIALSVVHRAAVAHDSVCVREHVGLGTQLSTWTFSGTSPRSSSFPPRVSRTRI